MWVAINSKQSCSIDKDIDNEGKGIAEKTEYDIAYVDIKDGKLLLPTFYAYGLQWTTKWPKHLY